MPIDDNFVTTEETIKCQNCKINFTIGCVVFPEIRGKTLVECPNCETIAGRVDHVCAYSYLTVGRLDYSVYYYKFKKYKNEE
jgi:hypothetical protein